MIKNCKIVSSNDCTTVVRFGDIEVQLPSIGRNVGYVNVEYANGKYRVVPATETPVKDVASTPKKNKKTPIEIEDKVIADENVEASEIIE